MQTPGETAGEATVLLAAASDPACRAFVADHVRAGGGGVLERQPVVVAVFDDPLAAVDTATRIGLAAAPAIDGSFAVRLGAAHGVRERDGRPGARVLERARVLCDAAEPGELLVGEVIHDRVAGDRELAFVGTLEARQPKVPPVPAWRRSWPAAAASEQQLPLPEGVRSATRSWGLFGRHDELARIERAWTEARDGDRRLVLLSGEPGIGKTRLAIEAARAAHVAGADVLYGRHDRGLRIPHQGFAEALEHLGAHGSDSLIAEVSADAVALAGVAPGLARRAEMAPGTAERPSDLGQVPFLAVATVVAATARRRPLLLVLEDLHGADRSTLQLLRHVLLGPFPMPALVLATYRPHELDQRAAAALGDLAMNLEAPEIELQGLGAGEISGLVAQLSGGAPESSRRLAGALRRDTAGNPLFVTEILRRTSPATADDEPQALPRSVREAIAGRVRDLGGDAGDLLVLAATIGRDFDPTVLAAAADRRPSEIASVLERAEAAGILEPAGPGGFRFAHAVIQRSLCDAETAAAAGRRHRAIAEAMERTIDERPVAPAALALHWSEAVPRAPDRALAWAQRAGEEAMTGFQPDAAATFFQRGLELCREAGAPDETRIDLLIGLGTARRRDGDASFRDTLIEAGRLADGLGDRERLVRAALANSRGIASSTGEVDPERVSLLERAVSQLGTDDDRARATLLAALARELTFAADRERRLALSDEAVAIARATGDRATLASCLIARFMPAWDPATIADRLADTREGVRLADELGEPLLQFHALHWRSVALIQAGQVTEARRAAERAESLARRIGDAVAPWLSSLDRSALAVIRGDLTEAERIAERSLELGRESGQPDAGPFYASQIACIRWHQGRLAELLPLASEMVKSKPNIPAFRSLLALAQAEAGARGEARRLLAAEADDGFERLPVDLGWLTAMISYAHAAATARDGQTAGAIYSRLGPFAGQIVYTGMSIWGDVEWALGRVAAAAGRPDEATAHLERSIAWAERNGAPLWEARARLSLAEELPGDDRELRFALAAEAAARAGAKDLERHARLLAGEVQATVPAVAVEVDLTPRQRDVMDLVARGQTNAEIADRLGISSATVKRHLEAVYARLEVGSRAEAVAKLLGRGG